MTTPEVSIVGIDHVLLAMPPGGEDRAREFYGRLLGIPEVPKPSELGTRGGVWFERGELRIHLGVETEFRPAKKAHPGLLVRNLPALLAELERANVVVNRDTTKPGCDRAFVWDPFGNRVELLEYRV